MGIIKLTKKSKNELYAANPGRGSLLINAGNDTILEIEVYVGMDNVLRRCGNGKVLFPFTLIDEENHLIEVKGE